MKRGAPLKRTGSLSRSTRLKRRRATPRRSGRVLNPLYLDAVRTLPCYVCAVPAQSDPDHQGEHPYGRKADDDTAVPMCRSCHRWRTDGFVTKPWHGPGPLMEPRVRTRAGRLEMRAWCDAAIAATRPVVEPMVERARAAAMGEEVKW